MSGKCAKCGRVNPNAGQKYCMGCERTIKKAMQADGYLDLIGQPDPLFHRTVNSSLGDRDEIGEEEEER